MDFGLHLGVRGPAAQPDSLRIIAEEAELLGFTHLGLSDHIVIANKVNSPYPYTKTGKWFAEDNGECLEQLTTLSFIAASTSHIRLLTSVMVLPHRPPILTAKMLNTIDVLSKGRLTVGLGVGWLEEEIALLNGPDFKSEALPLMNILRLLRYFGPMTHQSIMETMSSFPILNFSLSRLKPLTLHCGSVAKRG